MEAMKGWFSLSLLDNFNQDFAIRRFCPARVEEEQQCGEQETFDEMELSSSSLTNLSNSIPQLDTSLEEELEFVDSFLNVECYEKESNKALEKHEIIFDHPQEEFENFPGIDLYGDVPRLIDEGDELESCSSYDDLRFVSEIVPSVEQVQHAVDQGLHLVHSLLACAEAVGCRDTQLANSLLSQIWPSVSPWGDSLQRVAHCFAMGLKSRLSLLHNVNANGTFTNGVTDDSMISRGEKIEAFRLLHQTTPYIAFGFMAANDAIFRAAKEKDLLHIIDLGMENSFQWQHLIRRFASRTEGAPKLLRITGINEDRDILADLEASMKVIIDEASSLGIHVEFHIIAEPVTPLLLTRENLKLREGEVLFVNSIMNLHKFVNESRGSLKKILQAIKKLCPTLLTVVEQDANHNGPFFLGRFLESLHYYSAIFDSLEASLPRDSLVRMKIENFHFAEAIRNIVAYEGLDRIERHERADQWRRQIGRGGFQVVGMKCMSQVRTMLSGYGSDGYTVTCEKGCLLLGWKGRSIMLASAWQVHNVTSS